MVSPAIKESEGGDRFSSRYQVQQQLGKRGGRQTLLARDTTTQELVVIKLLSFGNEFEWHDLKLFEREAETLKSLSHPAIPRYLDYFEFDSPNLKSFALVQTYIAAQSLEEQLKAGRTFSEAEVIQLAKALLEILIYLHGRQPPVIHRDIKPSNILLTNRSGNSVGQVYLVDFGSVQTLAAREGGTITVVGTYGYMPPEQFGGRAVPASDLYSLGATLIYLVTGTHPADLPQKDLRLQFEQVINLSPELSQWLGWMTEPSLDRRIVSAIEALQALEHPQPQQPVSIYPTVTRRPVGSKIALNKDDDAIKIILPPQGFAHGVFGWTIFALFWNLGALNYTETVIASGLHPGLMLLLLCCWGIGLGITWRKVLFPLFGRVRITLDRQEITVAYKLFGCQYELPPIPREHICKLVRTKHSISLDPHSLNRSTLRKLPGNLFPANIEEESRLIVWAGTNKHELCSEKTLTDPELDWLAHELSTWLGLPIARE